MKNIKLFEKYNIESEFRTYLEDYSFLNIDIDKRKDFLDTMYSSLLEGEDFDPFGHLSQKDDIDTKKDCVLSFGDTNSKLKKLGIVHFSLPAAYTCPMADICKSFVSRHGKKFKNGMIIRDDGDVRCYSASTEARSPAYRNMVWKNRDLLGEFDGNIKETTKLIYNSIKYYETQVKKMNVVRVHDGGDFFSQEYFDAWLGVAKKRPDILFYCYTKSISFVVNRKNQLPKNFRVVGSVGGKEDDLLFKTPWLRKAYMVKTLQDAVDKKLKVDINDFLAIGGDTDFALLLHGTQPKATKMTSLARKNSKEIQRLNTVMYTDKDDLAEITKKFTTNRQTV